MTKNRVEEAYLKIHPLRETNSSYKYINPLLACIIPNSKEFFMNFSLEKKIKRVISDAKNGGKVKDVSVYYRDLNYGRWVGIDENTKYAPASMLKVIIMMAFYKQAETDPSLLKRPVFYSADVAESKSDMPYQSPSGLVIGKSYSIEKLIEELIVHSDNGARNALMTQIDNRFLFEAYTDLGLDNPGSAAGDYSISAKNYSLFFRILYNGTYLNREMSEKALVLLVDAQYKDGLVSGIPKNIAAAQKFGEYIINTPEGLEYGLHGCGIVYKPNNPYILCVMTKGTDIGVLTKTIQDISRTVYESAIAE